MRLSAALVGRWRREGKVCADHHIEAFFAPPPLHVLPSLPPFLLFLLPSLDFLFFPFGLRPFFTSLTLLLHFTSSPCFLRLAYSPSIFTLLLLLLESLPLGVPPLLRRGLQQRTPLSSRPFTMANRQFLWRARALESLLNKDRLALIILSCPSALISISAILRFLFSSGHSSHLEIPSDPGLDEFLYVLFQKVRWLDVAGSCK